MSALFYRLLLRMYPRDFRAAHGDEMFETFARSVRRGPFHATLDILDLVCGALDERTSVLRRDVSFALRIIAKAPLFGCIVIATLAAGIGASTATFSVVDGLLFEPLPYPNAERLAYIWHRNHSVVSPVDITDWQRLGQGFADVAGFEDWQAVLTHIANPRLLTGAQVTPDYFGLLTIKPELGRLFSRADAQINGLPAVVISDRLWRNQFAGSPAAIGAILYLNGQAYAVIGVAPPSFIDPDQSIIHFKRRDIWSLVPRQQYERSSQMLDALCRLRPDWTVAGAQHDLDAIERLMAKRYPATVNDVVTEIVPMREQFSGPLLTPLLIAMAGVLAVLLIVCTNVANLLLSRSIVRAREIAVRLAVGASRQRIVQQLLTESLMYSVAGSTLGLGIAVALVRILQARFIADLPQIVHFSVTPHLIAFAVTITLVTTGCTGILPALALADSRVVPTLRAGDRGASGPRHMWMRNVCIVAQIALAFGLIMGAAVLTRSFVALTHVDIGFDSSGRMVSAPIILQDATFATRAKREALLRKFDAALHVIPGVEATLSYTPPLTGADMSTGIHVPGRTPGERISLSARINGLSPNGLATSGLSLVQGRPILPNDNAPNAAGVAWVNEAFAKRYYFGKPLGKLLYYNGSNLDGENGSSESSYTIVGIVRDYRNVEPTQRVQPEFLLPIGSMDAQTVSLVVRSRLPPETVGRMLTSALRSVDSDLPAIAVSPYDRIIVDQYFAQTRVVAQMLIVLAGVALILAAAGLYGVTSYVVASRTHEIGIRVALGSSRTRIVRWILFGGLPLIGWGIAGGTLLSWAFGRALQTLLYGVTSTDMLSLGEVALILTLVALAASLIPALRAMQIEPMRAVRHE